MESHGLDDDITSDVNLPQFAGFGQHLATTTTLRMFFVGRFGSAPVNGYSEPNESVWPWYTFAHWWQAISHGLYVLHQVDLGVLVIDWVSKLVI